MRRVPLERIECINLMKWARYQKLPLIHIPNEGKRSIGEGRALRAMGLTPGVSDFFLPIASKGLHGLWLEMKRQEGGVLSEAQSQWLEKMRGNGYAAYVSKGWREGSDIISEYLKQ